MLLTNARIDLTYAHRLFSRQPAILLLTVVGLSTGLGIATAAFSVMNAAVLRGNGLVDSDRVPGVLRTTERSTSTTWTYEEFAHLRQGATHTQIEAVLTESVDIRLSATDANTSAAPVAFVSGGFFAATGGRLALGRLLQPADDAHTSAPPVVVGYHFWTSTLAGTPDAVGRTIWIGHTPATVIGVAAPDFSVPQRPAAWLPMTAYGAVYSNATRRPPNLGVEVVGRLMRDATIAEAEAQLAGVAATLPRDARSGDSPIGARLDVQAGLGRAEAADALAVSLMVFGVIAIVLLLACANAATILISTAIVREREMGLRAALGASRARLAQQLITESLTVGAVAAILGLLLAHWALPIVGTLLEVPPDAEITPDFTVYVFLASVSIVTSVIAGLAPAWHGRTADLLTALTSEGAATGRLQPRRLRSLLVMTQAAASVLLIVLSSLFVRATLHAARVEVGFEAAGLYAVSVRHDSVAADEATRVRQFWAQALAELRAVPGVTAVALAELTPFDGLVQTSITRSEPARAIALNRTGAGYFDTLGVPILAGRPLTSTDIVTRAPVAVISESVARAYFGDRSPLGEMLPEDIPLASARPMIVGVAGDAIMASLHERNAFAVYEPLDQAAEASAQLLIRVAPGQQGVDGVSQLLRSIDPHAGLRITSVDALVQRQADQPRTLAILSAAVGVVAILLCVVGLYGLTASLVSQRAREMGVRAAMGAERRDLLRLLMWDSLRPVAFGLLAGAGAALLASRALVATTFFGISPGDPMAYAGAVVTIVTAATLAVYVPTRRGASVDAARVLKQL